MNDNSEIINKIKSDESETSEPLFSKEELTSRVKKIIDGLDQNRLIIRFDQEITHDDPPVMAYLKASRIIDGEPLEVTEPKKEILDRLDNMKGIISGAIDAKPDQIFKAVKEFYKTFSMLQMRRFVKGSLDFQKDNIDELEKKLTDNIMKKVDIHIAKMKDDLSL